MLRNSTIVVSLVLSLSIASVGFAQETPVRERRDVAQKALEQLASGGTPQFAETKALPVPVARTPERSASRAFADAVSSAQKANKAVESKAIEAADKAMQKRFAEIEQKLRGLDLEHPEKALARLAEARQLYATALERLRGGQALKSEEAAALGDVTLSKPSILRSSLLPFRPLGLGTRAPVLSPTITPVYQDLSDPSENPEDRASSPTAPLSQSILAQAEALEYDYVRLFEFVRNEIELEWYAGSLRGAEGTLAACRGNAVDQASLLVALLRGSGAAARFVHGVIELGIDRLQEDLGLTSGNDVLAFLARSGIAHGPVIRGGRLDAVQIEHVWVAARIPYTNYRGAVVDRSGWTWLPLDPSLTQFETTPASDVLARMSFDAEAFRSTYLESASDATPLALLRDQVDAFLLTGGEPGATWPSQLATRAPVPEKLGLLPTSQSYPVVAITGESSVLDASLRSRLRLTMQTSTDPASSLVLDHEVALSEIAGRRFTLSYLPATVDDHRLVLSLGGLGGVPAYLVDVRPQLKVDGRSVAVGEPVALGRAHRFAIRLEGGWGQEVVAQDVISGSYLSLALGSPTATIPEDDGDDPADTEGLAARLLSRTAYGYVEGWDRAEDELAAAFDVRIARPLPSLAMAINAVRVTEIGGLPFDLSWQGVQLDAALRIAEPIGEKRDAWQRLAALEGSALEHATLESLLEVESISTAKGLGLARDQGLDVVTVSSANASGILPTLSHPQVVLDLLAEQIGAGQVIEIPRSQLSVRDWEGSIWSATDPTTGAEGYFLAGGLRGGATVLDPADWPIPELAAAFGDPFSGEPNRNPLAGAIIEPIEILDRQFGTVDRLFPEPLGVSVRDAIGRPVAGARVTFRIENSVGKLGSGQSAGAVQVVFTDDRGEALVPLKAGQITAFDSILIRRETLDRYRSQALRHVVDAAVDTVDGSLAILRPIEGYAFPGEVVTVERADATGTFLDGLLGFFSDSMTLSARDAFDNPVANVDLTAVARPPVLGALQDIDVGGGQTISCLVPEEPDTVTNATVFEAAVNSSGEFTGCDQATPTVGGCGRELITLATDWTGEAYVGVVLGDAMVGYEVGIRRSLELDFECERALIAEDGTFDELCLPIFEPPGNADNPVDPWASDFFFNYLPRHTIQTAHLPGQNPCSPLGQTVGRVEGFGAEAAVPPLGELPHPLQYSFYSIVPPCESNGPPECIDPPVCGAACDPEDEDCPPCHCDSCSPGNCDVCDDGWEYCSPLGDDFPVPACLVSLLGCDFSQLACDQTRWQWVPTPVVPEDPNTELSITGDGQVGTPGLGAPNQIDARVFGAAAPGENVVSGGVRYHFPIYAVRPSGELLLTDTRGDDGATYLVHEDARIATFTTLDMRMLSVEPETVRLSDDGRTLDDIVVRYRLAPEEYLSQSVHLELLENTDAVLARVVGSSPFGEGLAVIRRGITLDPEAVHDLRLTINPGSLYEIQGDPRPLPIDRQIIRSHSRSIHLQAETDLVNRTSCDSGASFAFQINEDAIVRLEARLVAGYNIQTGEKELGPPRVLFTGDYIAKGLDGNGEEIFLEHREDVFVEDLPAGDWELTLIANAQGELDQREALAVSELRVTDQLPLAHTMIKGVDLWNGTLTVGRQDLMVISRGPDLTFSRTYSSAGAQAPGPLGLGWRHNWLSSLRSTSCGEVVVQGGEGSGMRFRFADGVPSGGQVELAPLNGYRATLIANLDTGTFDFYTLAGIRYHYAPSGGAPTGGAGAWFLDYIEDPNGNRLDLDYAPSVDGPLLTTVEDASGRQIRMAYEGRSFVGWKGQVITEVTGPEGFGLRFDYDAFGHMTRATRADGQQDEIYGYALQPGWDFPLRQALVSVTDSLSGSVTSYGYEVGEQASDESGGTRTTLRLVELTEPASPVPTRFAYDTLALATGGGSPRTVVTDRRDEDTIYDFNRYGGVERIEDPLGHVSLTEWVPDDVLVARTRDARGIWTSYSYDEHANLLSETTGPVNEAFTVTMTYAPPGDFDPPYIKNRMVTKVDRDGDLTTLVHDARGNLLSETTELGHGLGPLTVSHTYDSQGDRRTMTDGRGFVTEYRFDPHGYPETIIDPLGHVTQLTQDERGRTLRTVDGRGNETLLGYDGLDRLATQQFASGDFETTEYDDVNLTRRRIDALGRATVTSFDREGRIARIDNAENGIRIFEYSDEGDKILESLWFDDDTPRHDIEYRYDAAGRLERRIEPLGRVTVYEHDGVGNVLSETLLEQGNEGFEPRVMAWPAYDPLNRPLREEKRLVDPLTGDERLLTTTFGWSGEGQKTIEVDPLGRTTSWTYDGLDRLIRLEEGKTAEHEPLRMTHKAFDGTGNLISETLENPLGSGDQTRSFAYDAAGRLTSEVDAEGHAAFYEYDEASNLIREIDRRGSVVEHDYDTRNRRVASRLRLSRGRDEAVWAETIFAYDAVGNLVSETQPNGNVVSTAFDGLDRAVSIADGVGQLITYGYDARSNRTSQIDGEGFESTVRFDALDRPVRLDLPEDRTVERSYDASGNILTEKNPRGHTTTYRYDTLERLRQVQDPEPFNYRLIATYDDASNVIAVTNRRGFTTDLEYDALNRPVRRLSPEIDGEHYVMTSRWDAADNLLANTDPRGITTSLTYDLENRRRTTTRAELLLETVQYDAAGSVRFVTDANGHTTGFEYDERGLVLALNQPEAATTRHAYDLIGNRIKTTDPELRQIQWNHDLRSRMASELIEVEQGRFATTFYEHDLRDLRTAVIRPKGEDHRWEWNFDGAGRLASVLMPDSGVTTYRYDPNSNLQEQVDAEGRLTSFMYDALDRRTLLTYPDGATKSWTHDENGNTQTRTDPSGRTTTFAYDAIDREKTRGLPLRDDGALVDQLEQITWIWDRNNNVRQVDESYTASGLHTTTRTFDAFDRLETVTDRFGREISYEYDAIGNRVGLQAPNQSTRYSYDGLNRLETVINGAGLTTYSYHRNSTLDEVVYPSGTTARYAYDTANRLDSIHHFQGQAEISHYIYSYDDHGNRTAQEEFQVGHGVETTTYDYDFSDRLELVVYPEKTVTYGYDLVGNRVSETVQAAGGGEAEIKSYAYDVRHRLETITHALEPSLDVGYAYDPNGNQIRKTKNGIATDFVFDALDRLNRIEDGGLPQGTYTFDYQGLRIQKQAEGRQVQYLYDDQSVLQRHDSVAGQITYDYGPDRLLSADHPTEGRSFYLFDGLGSIVGLTTPGGSVRAQYSYDAFGNYRRQSEVEGNVFGFTGHEMDAESGLIYARARFYDPDVGRFLSEDPAEDDYLNPPSLHKYAYAFQNPTVYTDPTGEVEFTKPYSGFFRRAGVDQAAEAAVLIESEYGKTAGVISAIVLGVLGAGSDVMAGMIDVADTAINVAVVSVAPTSAIGQEAAVELNATIDSTVQGAKDLYAAAKWAVENPEQAGALAVNAAQQLGSNIASGDVTTITKVSAFVAELAAGGRGAFSGFRKLQPAASAISQRVRQVQAQIRNRLRKKASPQKFSGVDPEILQRVAENIGWNRNALRHSNFGAPTRKPIKQDSFPLVSDRTRANRVNLDAPGDRSTRNLHALAVTDELDIVEQHPTLEGFFDVNVHGSPHSIQFGLHEERPSINHRALANYLRALPNFKQQKIRLISCSTGKLCNGFAQNLANRLNTKVMAASEELWVPVDRPMSIAARQRAADGTPISKPDPEKKGDWFLFLPGNRPAIKIDQ